MNPSATSGRADRHDPPPAAAEPPARGPVPRGQQARERVMRAALEVLAEEGLPGFTMEAVARRAGASKATVYRHWTSRGALLIDAVDLGFQPFPPPATGQLRTDMIELLGRLQDLLTGQPFPRLMAAFIDAAERDPGLRNLHAELTERRREPLRRVLQQARERGEIRPSADLELAIDMLAGAAFHRRLIGRRPFPDGYAASVVDQVLAALGYTAAASDQGTAARG